MAYNYPIEPDTRVSDIFFRTISGLFGGGFGTLILLIGVLLSGSFESFGFVSDVEGATGNHPLFVFIAIVVIYVSLLVSALASLTFFYYCDRSRYNFLLSTLSHVFALVTLIFVISTPLSILISLQSFDNLSIVALILMGVTTIFSVITMEVVANHKHLLLTLYSSAVALFSFFLLMLILYYALGTTSYLIVLALPFCWASFGFWQVSFEMIYQWVYGVYGSDFLNATTRVGSDYIKEQRMQNPDGDEEADHKDEQEEEDEGKKKNNKKDKKKKRDRDEEEEQEEEEADDDEEENEDEDPSSLDELRSDSEEEEEEEDEEEESKEEKKDKKKDKKKKKDESKGKEKEEEEDEEEDEEKDEDE